MTQEELYQEIKAIAEQSYDQLEGEWLEWCNIAKRFEHKVEAQDRLDLRHTIIVAFADQQARNERLGKPDLSFYGMLRIASHCVADYWRQQKRNGRMISLNTVLYEDEDGNEVELIDTLADDSIDIEAWLERSTWELGYPMRLVVIAHKLDTGKALSGYERLYLCRYRHKHQKRLF
ncbi:hypothetical protein ES707_01959 [subsurface metagenome]